MIYVGKEIWIQLFPHGLKKKPVVRFWIYFEGIFAHGSDTEYEITERIKKDSKIFELKNWKERHCYQLQGRHLTEEQVRKELRCQITDRTMLRCSLDTEMEIPAQQLAT